MLAGHSVLRPLASAPDRSRGVSETDRYCILHLSCRLALGLLSVTSCPGGSTLLSESLRFELGASHDYVMSTDIVPQRGGLNKFTSLVPRD